MVGRYVNRRTPGRRALEHMQPSPIGCPLPHEDNMTIIPSSFCSGRAFGTIALALIGSVLSSAGLVAQGLPVQNGPTVPIALWWIGAFVLALAIAYGILRNRSRTRSEKALTEQATKNLYAEEAREEERDRVKSGSV